jgi:hypothetical protein
VNGHNACSIRHRHACPGGLPRLSGRPDKPGHPHRNGHEFCPDDIAKEHSNADQTENFPLSAVRWAGGGNGDTALIELMQAKDARKSAHVMKAMLQMTKIDIAGLQRAYEGEGD